MIIQRAALAAALLLFSAGPPLTAHAGKEVFERVKVHVNAVAAALRDGPAQQSGSVGGKDERGRSGPSRGRRFTHEYRFTVTAG